MCGMTLRLHMVDLQYFSFFGWLSCTPSYPNPFIHCYGKEWTPLLLCLPQFFYFCFSQTHRQEESGRGEGGPEPVLHTLMPSKTLTKTKINS